MVLKLRACLKIDICWTVMFSIFLFFPQILTVHFPSRVFSEATVLPINSERDLCERVTEYKYPSNSNTCFYKCYFHIESDYFKWYSSSLLTSDLLCGELGFQFLQFLDTESA